MIHYTDADNYYGKNIMSDPYSACIVKFDGSFDDMRKLNHDLLNCNSQFIEELVEIATECNIIPMNFFGIGQYTNNQNNIGIICSDEVSIENEYHQMSFYYLLPDVEACNVIANHMSQESKLVISFNYENEEETFFIFEYKSWRSIKREDLF